MLKLLQRKFILVAMGSLLAVLLVLVGGMNLVHLYQSEQRTDGILWMLASYDGEFPEMQSAKQFLDRSRPQNETVESQRDAETDSDTEAERQTDLTDSRYQDYQAMWFLRQLLNAEPHISSETRFSTRYFTVEIDDDSGVVTQMNINHIAAVTEEFAQEYALAVWDSNTEKGYLEQYKYLRIHKESSSMFIFLDCTVQQEAVESFLYLSCGIALLVFVVVLLLVVVLSQKAIRPIAASIEKQKQFITDAGHELKTPLAIISANTDVLALYAGENEWTVSIRNQVERLNGLVQELLMLARMEEQQQVERTSLDFSALVEQATMPFAVLAAQKQVLLQLQLEPQIMIQGEAGSLQRLLSVLVDNAVKYVQEAGDVSVRLKRKGRFCLLEVYNSCDILPEGDLNALFDRFRRTDLSRARESGGYGIGLSVAQVITQAHHGKITAERREDGICFVVKLPC